MTLPSCQSGTWKKQASGGGNGGYTFQLAWGGAGPAYPTVFYAIGSYDSTTGKFSGEIMCNPHGDAACGNGSHFWCGADYSCSAIFDIYGYVKGLGGYGGFAGYVAGVDAIAVYTPSVTQLW